jgi:ribosome-binding protein aMBF1 (putative translation factor)
MRHKDYVAEREAKDPAFAEARERLRPEYECRRALIKRRIEAGLSQSQLAERLGTTQSSVARLESGKRLPTIDTLHRLAGILGVEFVITAQDALRVRPRKAG